MPQVPSNVQHAAVTNHAIPRRPDMTLRPFRAEMPLVEFNSKGLVANPTSSRELAIALMQQAAQKPEQSAPQGISFALSLEGVVRTRPNDVEAADALAQALYGMGESTKALGVMFASLEVAPNQESLLGNAAFVALQSGDLATAKNCAERAARISPAQVRYPMLLGEIAIREQRWDALMELSQKLMELSPAIVAPYQWRVLSFQGLGKQEQADTEFADLLRRFPDQADALRQWRQAPR
jgi:tetratricopeptide (TPR) repeat protein